MPDGMMPRLAEATFWPDMGIVVGTVTECIQRAEGAAPSPNDH